MKLAEVEQILKDVAELLGSGSELPDAFELAVSKLLNLVEALCSDKRELMNEVERLRKQLEDKKRGKTTAGGDKGAPSKTLSSEKRRPDPDKPTRLLRDRRSGKELKIHDTIPCPLIDLSSLPPDAVRHPDRSVVVQNIVITPRNIEFRQEVYYSPKEKQYYRGELPPGFDTGDFGPDLRALILALKYCGNMSEPKIGEFLENFDVEVSSGSISNILTGTASQFEEAYHQTLVSGLTSTTYQQTDGENGRQTSRSSDGTRSPRKSITQQRFGIGSQGKRAPP